MINFLMPTYAMKGILCASFVLAIIPGPGVLYLMSHTLRFGRSSGLKAIFGVESGNAVNAIIASCGLSVLMSASSLLLTALQLCGSAYLIYVGIRGLVHDSSNLYQEKATDTEHFRSAFVVSLLNPKTALFFSAFISQFIVPGFSYVYQSIVISITFVIVASFTDLIYVLASALFRDRFMKYFQLSYLRYVTSTSFIAIGVFAAIVRPSFGK